jgi:hypothetical protein
LDLWYLEFGLISRRSGAKLVQTPDGMDILILKTDERVEAVYFTRDSLVVDLMDGRTISVPLTWYPKLLNPSLPNVVLIFFETLIFNHLRKSRRRVKSVAIFVSGLKSKFRRKSKTTFGELGLTKKLQN